MRRERLKTRDGCYTCRSRKKKCDKVKPRCGDCTRLAKHCEWGTPSQLDEIVLDYIDLSHNDKTRSEDVSRVADHGSPIKSSFDLETFNRSIRNGHMFPALCNDFSEAFDQHLCFCAAFFGWPYLTERFLLDPQWQYLEVLDTALQRCGHGVVARAAFLSVGRSMMKYSSGSQRLGETKMRLPTWLIPKGSEPNPDIPPIISYLPWPPVRERLYQRQDIYYNDDWWGLFMSQGLRFLWPFAAVDAVRWDPEYGMLQPSDEFLLRSRNLRSYTVSQDWLAQFPEFQGDVPQTEAPLTSHQPSSKHTLEQLYWMLLRQKRQGYSTATRKCRHLSQDTHKCRVCRNVLRTVSSQQKQAQGLTLNGAATKDQHDVSRVTID